MTKNALEIEVITQHLPKGHNCYWVDSVTSTQSQVKPNSLLIAEQQTAGVGRRGKQWLTPKGRSVSLSYRFELALLAAQMTGYQITTALAIVDVIHAIDPAASLQLKWPNDLYHGGKKFAGILINLIPQQQHTEVIVGIGINWQLTAEQIKSVNQPVCNIPLSQMALNRTPRHQFIAQLVEKIDHHNRQFIHQGLSAFLLAWQKHDYLLNQSIQVSGEQQSETGEYHGINPQGELMLITSDGIKTFCSGEVSVKTV